MSASKTFIQPLNQPSYSVELKAFYNCNHEALIQVQASDDLTTDHVPSTIVLVIDVSGSMATAASIHDDSDGASGLSQLDVVKHASRTILESLREGDQVAVIAFASDVRTVFSLAPMTFENRNLAWKAVNALQPTSQTNLYGGLLQALDLIKSQESMPSNPNIMLLTDGMPNVSPPRGELASLQNYLDANPMLRQVRISTFGFGYNLQSQLLSDIATTGRSLYAFIPDASFVGTVFCNAVSNVLASASTTQLTLKLQASEGVTITNCWTGQSYVKTQWGLVVDLPSLLYGQTLEILVQTHAGDDPTKEPFQAFLEGLNTTDGTPLTVLPRYVDAMDAEDVFFTRAKIRSELIKGIRQANCCSTVRQLEVAQTIVLAAWQRVESLSSNVELPEVNAMKEDLNGQITEAYSRLDWHQKWGVHYVRSLACAHALQQCSNFKDPGVQPYATGKFSLLRNASEAKFVALPPPVASRRVRQHVSSKRQFHCSSNPCFAGGSLVCRSDGSLVSIDQIQAGNWIRSGPGQKEVQVRCVVETPIPSGMAGLCRLDERVLVTPWHPVRHFKSDTHASHPSCWMFPCDLVAPQWLPCDCVYSLVLKDGASSFQIGSGNYEAVSLGHGLCGDPAVEHDYLGTPRVLQDLARMKGWKNGRIVLAANPVIRDPNTQLIVGLRDSSSSSSSSSRSFAPVSLLASSTRWADQSQSGQCPVANGHIPYQC